MSGVLTTSSNCTCGHSGTVSTSSSTKLRVSDSPVLLQAGIAGQSVGNCSTTPAADSSGTIGLKCTSVTSVTAGAATKLQCGSQPVMLDALAGATNGIANRLPQTSLSATAGQTKLTAS